MSSLADIPLSVPRQNLNTNPKRHATTSYYARRVKESFNTRLSKLICSIFLTLLLLLSITVFVVSLSIRPHHPQFRLKSFSVPTLARENGFQHAEIMFEVTNWNPNHKVGIYYDAMSGSVYYRKKQIGATPLLFPFYQSAKNTTWIHGVLRGGRLRVTEADWKRFMAEMKSGRVVFRLELTAAIRFKVLTWGSKRHRMHASCEVGVASNGGILEGYKKKKCNFYFG